MIPKMKLFKKVIHIDDVANLEDLDGFDIPEPVSA
jgi:hypothetical protein